MSPSLSIGCFNLWRGCCDGLIDTALYTVYSIEKIRNGRCLQDASGVLLAGLIFLVLEYSV
jgi:hypothetical protein